MYKIYRFTFVLFFSLLLTNCTDTEQTVRNEVREASKTWIQHFNQGNTHAIADAYTSDALMVALPFGEYKGRTAISGFWTPFVQSGASDLQYSNINIKVIDNDKAILSASWRMNVGEGIITNETWIRKGTTWKLTEDHFEVTKQYQKNN